MNFIQTIITRLTATILFFGSAVLGKLAAQVPEGIPTETDSIDMQDTSEVWLYIIIPAIFVLVFFGLRYFRKNKGNA